MKLSKTNRMECPHCSSFLEGTASDYTVPSHFAWCEDECTECYESFKTLVDTDGMVLVEKVYS